MVCTVSVCSACDSVQRCALIGLCDSYEDLDDDDDDDDVTVTVGTSIIHRARTTLDMLIALTQSGL